MEYQVVVTFESDSEIPQAVLDELGDNMAVQCESLEDGTFDTKFNVKLYAFKAGKLA